ncbi:hypothetical protein NX059_000573 [Plenodomus lindquistii]|nr:hypothetical protein NX059_000573 [Plenodomus lindquistii]
MPSRVQSSQTSAPVAVTWQSPEKSKPRDEDIPSREVSIRKVPARLDQDDNGDVGGVNDWIPGVGDICLLASNGEQSFESNRLSRTAEDDVEMSPASPQTQVPKGSTETSGCPYQNTSTNTKRSALQRHCDFWDADHDGLIYPWDIFVGFRKLGFNVALCLWAAVTMCMCSSYSTQTSWMPHPMLAINLEKIDCCRHGSTTGAYDLDAELDPKRFDAIFRKYAEGKDYLTWRTMYDVWRGQCCANDFFGWFAGGLEWIAMYILLWPQDGRLRKEDIRGVYDGSIFFKIADART